MKFVEAICTKDWSGTSLEHVKLWSRIDVDLRKKYYECFHCKELHPVSEIKDLLRKKNEGMEYEDL